MRYSWRAASRSSDIRCRAIFSGRSGGVMDTIDNTVDAPVIIARERIAVAAGAALLVAGLILVIAVLPAEYGVDPLGIGAKLGLTALNDTAKNIERFRAGAETGV